MKRFWSYLRGISLLAALLASGIAAGQVAEPEESDSATLRSKALEEWYHETYGTEITRGRPVGRWSAAYRRFMLQAAARERGRWGRTVIQPDGASTIVLTGEAAVNGTAWNNLGPTGANFIRNGSYTLNKVDSGRVRSIVVHPGDPNTIYVAFSGGGVWKTTNGGSSWTPITESVGSLACGSLAMDPSNPNVLYLGLGDPFDGTGIGLVKSTDGGATWSAPVYLGASTVIAQVMVTQDPNVVLAATNAGLFRSTNGGASWSQVSLNTGFPASTPSAWSIAWTGASGYVVSLEATPEATSGTTNGQVWFTTNNGASWTRATGFTASSGVGRITLASAPSNRSVVYAMAAIPNNFTSTDLADFFKSTNGGSSWTALNVTRKRYSNANTESRNVNTILNGQGWYDQLVVVHPTNANTAYFGGALLLAKTTDGGSTYSQITNWLAQFGLPYVHADFHAASFDSAGAFYVGTDGGIFKSTDAGTTWSDTLNRGIASHLLYSLGSSTASVNAVIGGMQDNGTRVRDGATATFNQLIGGDGFGSDIHPTNGSLMLGSLYYARIQKSTNGGSSFTQSCSGIAECGTSNAPFITRIARWTGDPTGNTVFTISNTKVYRSTNYGSSWSALGTSGLPTTNLYLRNVNAAHSNVNVIGAVANAGRVYLSSNGGASWTERTPPNNGFSLSYIHFDSTDPNTVYVASVAPDSTKTHLWKSTNFGQTWTAIDGGGFPAGVPVDVIKNDPGSASTLYAGTHLGVYRSLDGGNTWARFGTGMPLVEVSDLYISPDSSLVRAATYGRGFWQLQ